MFQRLVTVSFLVLAMFAITAIPSAAQNEGTFNLSVGTLLCDANPYETSDATCEPVAGVVVVTLESGEFVGSCTSESGPTPNGGSYSGCGVDGVPFNATLLVAEDPATIPSGYVPVNSPQIFQTTDIIPGGGDGPVLDLIYVQANEPPAAISQDSAPASGPDTNAEAQGRSVAIHTGNCADLGSVAAALPSIIDPQGPPVGQASAIQASTTSATVPVSLDVLIDHPHSVVVLESNTANSDVIACGDIGGVDNDDGELIIRLREVSDSDYSGMAYLAYSPADSSQTAVSIFLAPGLRTTP